MNKDEEAIYLKGFKDGCDYGFMRGLMYGCGVIVIISLLVLMLSAVIVFAL